MSRIELDEEAKKIIQSARQRNVSNVMRSPKDHLNIIADYQLAQPRPATQGLLLELGPGHFLLPRLLQLDSTQYIAIDSDPAVAALGKHLGFRVVEDDLKKTDFTSLDVSVSALFCKYAYNAFWFAEQAKLRQSLVSLLRKVDGHGWGWFTPWNGGAALRDWSPDARLGHLRVMDNCFEEFGWVKTILTRDQVRRYGLGSSIPEIVVYRKGLLQ